jgi:hypothetical protein
MKLAHVLVAYAAALSGMCGPSYAIAAPPKVATTINVPELMQFACSVLEYDCSQIDPPKVDFAPLYGQMGAIGAYWPGTDTIYLDNQLLPYMTDEYVRSIAAHEITHYVDERVRGAEEMALDPCQTENRGWRVGNAYLIVHGREDLVDYSWYERYNCYSS